MRELFEFIAILFVVVLFVVVCGAVPAYLWGKYDCSVYQEKTGLKTEWEALTCYITENGKTIPQSEYQMRAITNEKGE